MRPHPFQRALLAVLACTMPGPATAAAPGTRPVVTPEAVSGGNEDGTPIVFRVRRTGDRAESLPVRYRLSGEVTPGRDYVPPSGHVTIERGAEAALVEVATLDDSEAEASESATVWIVETADYDVPEENRWIEPPPVPEDVRQRLARLPTVARAHLPPLAWAGHWRRAEIVRFTTGDGRPRATIAPPEALAGAMDPFWWRGCEAVIGADDAGVWTLARRSGQQGPWYRLTLYPSDPPPGIDVIRLDANPNVALRGYRPAPAPDDEPMVELSRYGPTVRLEVRGFDGRPRRNREPAASLDALLAANPEIASSHLRPMLRLIGAAVSTVDAWRAFPELAPAPESVEWVRKWVAELDADDFGRREAASRALAGAGHQQLGALVRVRFGGEVRLSAEQSARIDACLAADGWLRVPDPAAAAEDRAFLTACLTHPDPAVQSAARGRLRPSSGASGTPSGDGKAGQRRPGKPPAKSDGVEGP